MFRLIESIKLKNGVFQNLEGHSKRLNQARSQLFAAQDQLDLKDVLDVPERLNQGVYKCRILYGQSIDSIEFIPYVPKKMRFLKLVECNEIDYSFKFEDRSSLELLLQQKGEADDILIVKNGFITDTSFSNMIFFDGEKWMTPATFLLNGTQRQRMLSEGIITEADIRPTDLKRFKSARPINAMLEFEETAEVTLLF